MTCLLVDCTAGKLQGSDEDRARRLAEEKGLTLEILPIANEHRISAACPHCGSTALEKLLATPAAPGKSKAIIAGARAAANKEGHFSNFSAGERKKILKA